MKYKRTLLFLPVVAIPLITGIGLAVSDSARILAYRAILVSGPINSRRWAFEKLKLYKHEANLAISQALFDRNLQLRYDALHHLKRQTRNVEDAVPNMIRALRIEGDDYRYELTKTLKYYKSKALPALRNNLHHSNVHVRYRVVDALGGLGADAFPELFAALHDRSPYVRAVAANGLRHDRSDDVKVRDQLLKVVDDPEAIVRASVIGALGYNQKCHAEAIDDILSALADEAPKVRESAIDALRRIQGEPLPAVVAALKSPDRLIKVGAIKALRSCIGDKSAAITALRACLADTSAEVRTQTLETFWYYEDDAAPAVPEVIQVLNDERAVVQEQALYFFMQISTPESFKAFPRFLQLTKSKSELVRYRAIEVIGNFGPQAISAFPRLMKALKSDSSYGVRSQACSALGKIAPNNPEFQRELLAAFEKQFPDKRLAIKMQLSAARTIYDCIDSFKSKRARLIEFYPGRNKYVQRWLRRCIIKMSANEEEKRVFLEMIND